MDKYAQSTSRADAPKISKGAQPSFFDVPALEAMHGMMIILLEQICVLHDRLDTYERLGEQGIAVTPAAVEAFEPDEAVETLREEFRQRTIDRVMRPVKALQQAALQDAQQQYEQNARQIAEQDF